LHTSLGPYLFVAYICGVLLYLVSDKLSKQHQRKHVTIIASAVVYCLRMCFTDVPWIGCYQLAVTHPTTGRGRRRITLLIVASDVCLPARILKRLAPTRCGCHSNWEEHYTVDGL